MRYKLGMCGVGVNTELLTLKSPTLRCTEALMASVHRRLLT